MGRERGGSRGGHGEGEGRKQGWTWGGRGEETGMDMGRERGGSRDERKGRGDEEQASWQLGKMRRERGQGRVEGWMECH